MTTYKAITKVEGMREPFVDWYQAENKEKALELWKRDIEQFVSTTRKVTVEISEAEVKNQQPSA